MIVMMSQKIMLFLALIKKIHNAKVKGLKNIKLWGTGKAKREFLYVDDVASGIIHILKNYKETTQ